jgi:carboxylesterase
VAGPLLAGHGSCAADLNKVSWRDWVASGAALYHDLAAHCERVFVAGQSTGGLVALYLASQYPQISGVIGYAPAIQVTLSPLEKIALRLLVPFAAQLKRESLDCGDNWQGYPDLSVRGAVQLLAFQTVIRQVSLKFTSPSSSFKGG